MPERALPESPEDWVAEILLALKDARATKPFALLTGTILTERKLFHLAPKVAFKFRGLHPSEEERRRTVEAALSNYVVFTDPSDSRHVPELKRDAKLAFALCYVAAHYALDLITEDEGQAIMGCCEECFSATGNR